MEHTSKYFSAYGWTKAHKSSPAVAIIKMNTIALSFRESRSVIDRPSAVVHPKFFEVGRFSQKLREHRQNKSARYGWNRHTKTGCEYVFVIHAFAAGQFVVETEPPIAVVARARSVGLLHVVFLSAYQAAKFLISRE